MSVHAFRFASVCTTEQGFKGGLATELVRPDVNDKGASDDNVPAPAIVEVEVDFWRRDKKGVPLDVDADAFSLSASRE